MAAEALNPAIRLPRVYRRGEIIDVRTFVAHPMETGLRKDPATGDFAPEDIITSLRATLDGREVFRAALRPGTSANPFIAFPLRVEGPGELVCTWDNGRGRSWTATATLDPAG
jgi:sulfur-oxidizing protein SoxZ